MCDESCSSCLHETSSVFNHPCFNCKFGVGYEKEWVPKGIYREVVSFYEPKVEEEEKVCENCKHFYKDLDEYPCTDCKYHSGNNDKWEYEKQDNVNHPPHIRDYIIAICEEIKTFLIKKNEAYGNSVPDPIRIFSKADALEQINVRIDDKLSRIMRGKEYGQEDTELDLIGYLILKRAVKRNMIEEL